MEQLRRYCIVCRGEAQLTDNITLIRKANEVSQAYVHEYWEDNHLDATVFVYNKHPYKPRTEDPYHNDYDMGTMSALIDNLGLSEEHTEETWVDSEQEYGEMVVRNKWYRIK